jgi:hypothetical protein
LRHRVLVFGELRDEVETALAAYGGYDEDAVVACDPLVVGFTATWGVVTQPDHLRTRARLDWLRDHLATL